MTRPTLEERRKRRQTERLIDRVTTGWWVECPAHGRSPVHPYGEGCFYCQEARDGR